MFGYHLKYGYHQASLREFGFLLEFILYMPMNSIFCPIEILYNWEWLQNSKLSLFQQEISGYQPSLIRKVMVWFFIIITAGLLRLFFYWLPHLFIKCTHSKCSLAEAEIVILRVRVLRRKRVYLDYNHVFCLVDLLHAGIYQCTCSCMYWLEPTHSSFL